MGLRSSFYVERQNLSIVARGHINSKEFRSGFHHNILRIRCQLTLSHSGERHTLWHSAGSDLTSGYVEGCVEHSSHSINNSIPHM